MRSFWLNVLDMQIEERDLKKLIVVGDRVLIKPKVPEEKTRSGLILPPGVHEKEKVRSGYVVKVGPGYPVPMMEEADESWKPRAEDVKYVPLQPREADLAVYLQNSGYEIEFNKEKYVIVPHSAILLLVRDDSLFE